MATFTDFSDLLPDPDNKQNSAGVSDSSGSAGPGFAKIKFRSTKQLQKSKTISGRGVNASPNSHSWEFDINYNPLTRDEFEPVSAFLETRDINPFFVILPQYNRPRSDTFNTFVTTNTVTVSGAHSAGSGTLTITSAGTITGDPSVGDFFTITDPSDANHMKVYKVVRVETPSYYQSGLPVSANTRRIHTKPELTRDVSSGSVVNFRNPKFRVQQKGDIIEYDLGNEGLYDFSLSLEEIQP